MREIKFRAWDLDNEQMYFNGDSFGTNHDYEPLLYKKQGQNVEVMQYTGLKDANGVEIYEGDIVGPCSSGRFWVIEWGSFGDTGFYGSNQINSCRRLEPGAYLCYGAILEITENETLECVVIGNIHENPELLK